MLELERTVDIRGRPGAHRDALESPSCKTWSKANQKAPAELPNLFIISDGGVGLRATAFSRRSP
jgi:hypothetical protein